MIGVLRAHTFPGRNVGELFLYDAGGSVDRENFEYDERCRQRRIAMRCMSTDEKIQMDNTYLQTLPSQVLEYPPHPSLRTI